MKESPYQGWGNLWYGDSFVKNAKKLSISSSGGLICGCQTLFRKYFHSIPSGCTDQGQVIFFFARSIASEVGEALLERIGIPAWMTFKVISVGILPLEYTIHWCRSILCRRALCRPISSQENRMWSFWARMQLCVEKVMPWRGEPSAKASAIWKIHSGFQKIGVSDCGSLDVTK